MLNAICELSVIPLRKEPSDRSEMTSQVIFGERMEILEEQEKWSMVRLIHDGYEGWVSAKQIVMASENQKPTSILTSLFEMATSDKQKRVILPAGAKIQNPTEEGFYMNDRFFNLAHAREKCVVKNDLIQSAQMFVGTPYLWGGRTFAGIDCSGFSQVVFALHGKMLKRDAYQQVEMGEVVSFVEECVSGDLAFFDNAEGNIIHVGIVMEGVKGAKKIIHASGEVRIDALDHQGIFNEDQKNYTHHLRTMRRI